MVIGRVIKYRGKRVKIIEKAIGFVNKPESYWVRVLEPVDGYKEGEEFTVSKRHVFRQLNMQVQKRS